MKDKYFQYRSDYINKQLDELSIIGLSDTSQTIVKAEREPRAYTCQHQKGITSHTCHADLVEIDSLSNAINMEELIVTRGIRRIENNACMMLPKLNKVVIESSDTIIEEGAFAYCPQLEIVVLPDESLRFYPAFKGSPVYDSLIDRYHRHVNKQFEVKYNEGPIGSDYTEAFSGCHHIEYVHLRCNEQQMCIGNITTMRTRVRNLTMAFFNCSSLKSIIIPEKVDKMNGALMGCANLTEIAMLGAYKRPDVFGLQYTAEQVEKLILFSEEPMIIGSTPNAVWYVPERSINAYKQAIEDFNNRDGMLTGYIYCRDIKPLQEASKGLKSLEIHKLLVDKGYAPKEIFNSDLIDAHMESMAEEYAKQMTKIKKDETDSSATI